MQLPNYIPGDSNLSPGLLRELVRDSHLLRAAADAVARREPELKTLTELRRYYSAEAARAALIVARTSHRALEGKFEALRSRLSMFYATPEALEQATPPAAGLHKAGVMAMAADGSPYVVDVGCGIGGDSIALSGRFPVLAMDISPTRALMAGWNLQALARRHLVIHGDVTEPVFCPQPSMLFHADPARRSGGRRRTDQFFPDLDFLAEIGRRCGLGAIKVSPAANFGALPPFPLEIISVDGDVVEATLWMGARLDALQIGPRTATVIDGAHKWRMTGIAQAITSTRDEPDEFIFETAGAVTRSGLAPKLISGLGLEPMTGDGCYATGSVALGHPAVRVFRVLSVGPFDLTRLRRTVAGLAGERSESGKPQLEVKTRGGLGLDTDHLQRKLAPLAKQSAVIIIYRSAFGVAAAVTQRVNIDPWKSPPAAAISAPNRPDAESGVVSAAETFSMPAAERKGKQG